MVACQFQVLFQLIRSCNRSAPHIAVMVKALHILGHLVLFPGTVDAVASEAGTFDLLVEIVQM